MTINKLRIKRIVSRILIYICLQFVVIWILSICYCEYNSLRHKDIINLVKEEHGDNNITKIVYINNYYICVYTKDNTIGCIYNYVKDKRISKIFILFIFDIDKASMQLLIEMNFLFCLNRSEHSVDIIFMFL